MALAPRRRQRQHRPPEQYHHLSDILKHKAQRRITQPAWNVCCTLPEHRTNERVWTRDRIHTEKGRTGASIFFGRAPCPVDKDSTKVTCSRYRGKDCARPARWTRA